VEVDPPEFLQFRRLLNPHFSPKAIAGRLPKVERWTNMCLDRVIQSGHIDVVADLANPIPALFTMDFLGLPLEEWADWSWPQHQLNFAPPGSKDSVAAKRQMTANQYHLAELVAQQREQREDGLVSELIDADLKGRRLTDREIVEVCMTIISGGFATTTALTGHALLWLSEHPEAKEWLMAEPDSRIGPATEEFVRWSSPAHALARTVTSDVNFAGQKLQEGDRVLLCWASANHDESVFEAPDQVRLDRTPNRHAAFGFGVHRCIGGAFARAEFGVILRQVLERIPDYEVDTAATQRFPSVGVINGFISMPATFTPGRRTADVGDLAALSALGRAVAG
jgi:cytochrome P450